MSRALQFPPSIQPTVDQLQAKWGHIQQAADLAGQVEWSRPLHRKEKFAYVFWKCASQDSINEICESFGKESITRPREIVKLCMSRLLAYDMMYDSEAESSDEGNDDEEEVDIEEILNEDDGEEGDERDLGETDGTAKDDDSSGLSDHDSLLIEALEAMEKLVEEDRMMDSDEEEEEEEMEPDSSLDQEKVQEDGMMDSDEEEEEMESDNSFDQDQVHALNNNIEQIDLNMKVTNDTIGFGRTGKQEGLGHQTISQADTQELDAANDNINSLKRSRILKLEAPKAELNKPSKRKLSDNAPQCSKPPKKPRPSLDAVEKLAKELSETWAEGGDMAPIDQKVKETRIALRIVGERGTKSIKYKMEWTDAPGCSFPPSWVEKESELVTKRMLQKWEWQKKWKGKDRK